jgi:spermidine synthase
MMLFMGIGSDLQKHLKDKRLFDKFVLFEVLLGMVGGFGPILLLWTFGIARDHYVLLQYGLIISTGFLIGLEIPILARINERYTSELRVNIGGILRMDYIGAFTAAVLWAYVFIAFFSPTRIGFVLGLFNLITAAVSLVYFKHLAHRKGWLGGLIAVCTAAMVTGLIKAPEWTAHAEQRLFLDKIIYTSTTKYQHIVLTRGHSGEIFCYINGNTQFSSYDEHIYHEMLVHPAMKIAPSREKVLVLGGGDGLAVREILKYDDVEEVTLVDLDPGMTDLARDNPYMSALNDNALADSRLKVIENNALVDAGTREIYSLNRTELYGGEPEKVAEVAVVNVDAAAFVDQVQGFYDVIVIDFPDPNNLELSKLYSRGFYTKVRDKLSRHGILVLQSTSPVHAKEAFLCIGRTLEAAEFSAVPFHDNVPSFGEWGWWIAGKNEVTTPARLKERLNAISELEVPVKYLTPELIHASLHFGKGRLETQQTQINTILNNVIYLYYSDALLEGY